jgi:hypothetical protein
MRGDRFHGRVRTSAHLCAEPGCRERGEFRAPLQDHGFDGPGAYRWLCLDHVRAFNDRYNFFDGMSPDEIAEAQLPYAAWPRETRAFSANPDRPPRWTDFNDPLDAISARFRERKAEAAADARFTAQDRAALKTLGLGENADRKALRTAYSALVRKYHPDRNGGDRSFETRLQAVVEAYQHLRSAAAFA